MIISNVELDTKYRAMLISDVTRVEKVLVASGAQIGDEGDFKIQSA
jgi:hypothetical protein